MKIHIVLGSTRPGRVGERVAKWVAAVAAVQENFEVELVDLADFDMPRLNEMSPRFNPKRNPDPAVKQWLAKVAEADGFVFVTPEYNHSIPGVLKDALDFIAFEAAKKPAAIVSYGTVGGARAAEHLKGILIEAKMAVVPEALALMGAAAVLDEKGEFTGDAPSPFGPDKVLVNVLEQLEWWTKTLKAGREELATV